MITKLGLPSLVVTLAGLIAWRGAARILVEDRSVGDYPGWFNSLGQDELLGPLPFSILLFVGLFAIAAVILHRSEYGRYIYVIGDNTDVATLLGHQGRSHPHRAVRRRRRSSPARPGSSLPPGWAPRVAISPTASSSR